ncbi:MAG: hypothetical protein ACLVL2_01905 [Bacteroides cellulosilyticus]
MYLTFSTNSTYYEKTLPSPILCTLFSLSAASIETVDYTQEAFRMVRHSQQSRWTSYLATCQRHRGESGQAWESRSALPIRMAAWGEYHGLHIRRTNHTE